MTQLRRPVICGLLLLLALAGSDALAKKVVTFSSPENPKAGLTFVLVSRADFAHDVVADDGKAKGCFK